MPPVPRRVDVPSAFTRLTAIEPIVVGSAKLNGDGVTATCVVARREFSSVRWMNRASTFVCGEANQFQDALSVLFLLSVL
jgi:hypothetical protein